jgi:hypothetical protein
MKKTATEPTNVAQKKSYFHRSLLTAKLAHIKEVIIGNEPPLNAAHTIYSGQKERADVFMEILLVFRNAQVSPLSGQLLVKDNAFLHISTEIYRVK